MNSTGKRALYAGLLIVILLGICASVTRFDLLQFLAEGKTLGINILFMFSEEQRAFLFPVYFILAGFCLYFRRRLMAVKTFLIFFFALYFFFGGLAGQTVWPFASWHLYVNSTPRENTFYEYRAVDAQGKELKYDVRALPLCSATFLNRMAKAMAVKYSDDQKSELGKFMVRRANQYRKKIMNDQFFWQGLIRYPRHQFGYLWAGEALTQYSEFVAVALYKIDVQLSEDGRSVVKKHEELVGMY